MSTPNRKNADELVKDLLWQNHALTKLNADLLADVKRLQDEIAELKAKPADKAERPSIVR